MEEPERAKHQGHVHVERKESHTQKAAQVYEELCNERQQAIQPVHKLSNKAVHKLMERTNRSLRWNQTSYTSDSMVRKQYRRDQASSEA